MKELDFDKKSEKALENWLLQKYDPINWEMGYSCELEDLPAIIPLIEIKDNGGKGRTFMFGNDIHDTLVVETANNRSGIYYLNLQNSCSSRFCDEGYEIVDNGNIKGDYIEPHIRLVNLKSCIERYNKNNGIDELKKENKKLRKLGEDYAKQCEDNYNELEKLKKRFISLQEKEEKIDKLQKQLGEKEKEIEKLRKLHSIRDDASQCEIVNGVKFNAEQIMIIALLKENMTLATNEYKKLYFDSIYERGKLQRQLEETNAEIVEKIYKYLTQEENWKKLRKAWLNNGECEYLRKSLDTLLKEYQK